MVGRDAPEEIKQLCTELALLAQSIKILTDEVQNPSSTLNNAGDKRKQMVNEMMASANETLLKLQEFSRKHDLAKAGRRSKLKRTWHGFVYARRANYQWLEIQGIVDGSISLGTY